MSMLALDQDTIRNVLSAIGLRLDFESPGFQSLNPELQQAVRRAEQRYRAVVGTPADEEDLALLAFLGREPGCKSALFQRLLSGREPFPTPPPTSHSYPWYSLLDNPGPRSIQLGGAATLGSHLRAAVDHPESVESCELLAINQCYWRIDQCNEAARTLMTLHDDLDAAVSLARRAEWVVRHPGAPGAYRVYWGTDGALQRGFVAGIAPSLSVGEFEVKRTLRTEEEDLADQVETAAREAQEPGGSTLVDSIAGRFARLAREARAAGPIPRGPLVEYVRHGWMLAPTDDRSSH